MIVETKIHKKLFNSAAGNWLELKNGVGGGATLYAQILRFDKPSEEYGINGGRISKLMIRDANYTWLANYDRGWDIRPKKEAKAFYDEIIRKYN